MTPTTTQPKTNDGTIPLTAEKTGFDLNAKDSVILRKVGSTTPIVDMADFLQRMNNDNAAIMALIQKGYESLAAEKLAADSSVPWQQVVTDEVTKAETLVPFDGFLLEGDRLKNFNLTVLGTAKMMFGYPDEKPADKSPESLAAWRKAKDDARNAATEMFLSNPAAVAALKK